MARITIEDCLRMVPNRFEVVILASQRARQLFQGAKPLVKSDNLEIVTALREIAAGKVRKAGTYCESEQDGERGFSQKTSKAA